MATARASKGKDGKPKGRWITTDEGHHVFISSKGELLIHGPGSRPAKVAGGQEHTAALIAKAKAARAPAGTPTARVKDDRARYDQATRVMEKIPKHRLELATRTGTPGSNLYGKNAEVLRREDQLKGAREKAAGTMTGALARITHGPTTRAKADAVREKQRAKVAAYEQAQPKPVPPSPARAAAMARQAAVNPAPKPADSFSLTQRSATGRAPIKNLGGKQASLFDAGREKSRDLPGQGRLFDKGPDRDVAKLVHGDRTAARPELKPVAQVPPREALASGRSRTAARLADLKKVSDVQSRPETHAQPGDVVNMKTGAIHFDPDRFQYKLSGSGEHGVSSQLHGVKNWNSESAGVLSVWKDHADGKTYVINGHHRLDLANRLGVDKVTARFIDAPDAKTARMKGAITNIAEGRGTAIDAAKFFRDAGIGKEAMHVHGIPMTEATAKHGLNMAGLEEGIFKRVVNQEIPIQRASILGGSGLAHEHQRTVLDQATKMKASDATLRELIDNAKSAPTIKQHGRSLFGDTEDEVSLAGHRATVQAHIARSLAGDQKLFGLVSKSKAAQSLEERGRSHIDTEETGKVSAESAQVMGVFHTLKNRSGPVASELNRASERLHAGEDKDKVLKDTRAKVTEHVKKLLSGGVGAFD